MSRKDFELIAETIRYAKVDETSRVQMAAEFAESLRRSNPRFDAERFKAACVPMMERARAGVR